MDQSVEPTLRVQNVAIAYATRRALVHAVRDVTFEVKPGEVFGLVGESGCGKSTVAYSLVNFLGANGKVIKGEIVFEGRDMVNLSADEVNKLRGRKISMVYQDPMQALTPTMRLGEQLTEVLTTHQKIKKTEAKQQAIDMLHRVHMPDPEAVMDRYPHQVSGGQQQRVVIAMALLNNPSLLIMDEPTTALDVTVEAAVLDLLEEICQQIDTSILFITHNLGVIARVADTVGVMYAGEMVELASAAEIFETPRHPYTQGLMSCVPRLGSSKESSALYPIPGRIPPSGQLPKGCAFEPRCEYSRESCKTDAPSFDQAGPSQFVRCPFAEEILVETGGRLLRPVFEATKQQDFEDEAILNVESAKLYYEHASGSLLSMFGLGRKEYVKAVDNVSLCLDKGRTLGIVGESGCGKSSLARGIVGLEPLQGGKIELLGFDVSRTVQKRDLSLIKELQMVFQNPDSVLNPSFTIGRQIERPLRRFGVVPKNEIRDEVVRLLRSVRLNQSYYDRLPRQLSGGEKQRVGIARAFAGRPEVIICDEPVSALDVSVQAAILNLLIEIQRERGATIIFISHDLSVVRFFSDEVAVMYLGELVELGPAEAIYTAPSHPYTEALLSAVPVPDPNAEQPRIRLHGRVPSALNPPSGCHFHTRCPRRDMLPDGGQVCEEQIPPWREVGDGHRIYCHLELEQLQQLGA